MRKKLLNHAVFSGPVKLADIERTSMYRDYLAQINDPFNISANTVVTEKNIPPKKLAGSNQTAHS